MNRIIEKLERLYDPEHDLAQLGARVTATDKALLTLIKDLYKRVEELEKRLDRQPLPYPGEGGGLL